jgi:hypothetical protein
MTASGTKRTNPADVMMSLSGVDRKRRFGAARAAFDPTRTFEFSALLTSLWCHKRQRPLLHNIQWNVYLTTQAVRFKPKSRFTL